MTPEEKEQARELLNKFSSPEMLIALKKIWPQRKNVKTQI